ncbi:LysR family transcriptional regulator [Paracoccus benzoatiresistens]|uniref:LysR family transcriptional regulator n=1 Tax=Paracoccus benzoatiresistens TaxID=2997341 RepID=A0ABT4J9K1_9RHOB|nr:LysR family transcriptional regulator [Paracoccus sp. EF6]MCZ0963764.1 LysR family transcriptional regulator [Paracoccus sp. EF6]
MDKLSAMQAYCRIVDRGSFTRAAEDLGVSAALLSREVSRLEASLGVALLSRTTRRMTLTEAGRTYYDEALVILQAVGSFEERIQKTAGVVSGHLKVNAPSSFGQVVVAPMLPGFCKQYPDLRVSLTLDDRVIDMVEGGFDLTLRIRSSMKDSTLRARKLGEVRVGIFASADYLARNGSPTTPEDIRHHQTCGYLLSEHLDTWDLTGPGGEISVPVDPKVRVGNSFVLVELLVAGMGLGTLPDFISGPAEEAGVLVRVLPDYALPTRAVWAVLPAGARQDGRVGAFLRALKEAISDLHS